MAEQHWLSLKLTATEANTIALALSEYLYLLEEGTIDELLQETDAEMHSTLSTVDQVVDLKSRVEALL